MPHSITPPSEPATAAAGQTRRPKLVLSRVEEQDWDELLQVQYEAFKAVDIHQALFGPNTKDNRERVKQGFIQEGKSDISDCWLKLVDENTGKIVSASQWKVYPSWTDKKKEPFQAAFYEGQVRKDAEHLANDFMARRARDQYGSPHVLLYILFTHPDYQRCGAGSIHVKWGTDLADRLLVPTWVEASPDGHHLYESNGFRDVEKVYIQTENWLADYTIMKREPKTSIGIGRSIVFS